MTKILKGATEKYTDRTAYKKLKEKSAQIEREYIRVAGKLIRRVDYVEKDEVKIVNNIIQCPKIN